jgi:hypothetical protein
MYFGLWQFKTNTDLLCSPQTEIAVLSQFQVTLTHALECVPRPKMFQRFRAIRLMEGLTIAVGSLAA